MTVLAAPPLSDSLQVSIAYDQSNYPVGATTINATVTLRNTGTKDITGVTVDCTEADDTGLTGTGKSWGALANGAAGIEVKAGTTVTSTVSEPLRLQEIEQAGDIYSYCMFGSPDHNNHGWPVAEATATYGAETAAARRPRHPAPARPAPPTRRRVLPTPACASRCRSSSARCSCSAGSRCSSSPGGAGHAPDASRWATYDHGHART